MQSRDKADAAACPSAGYSRAWRRLWRSKRVSFLPRTLLASVMLLMSGGSVALAEPADQAATATPAPAAPTCPNPPGGIVIDVANPPAGAVLSPGTGILINGSAYDVTSTTGPGVDSVTAFLGSRDSGGLFLGTASLGQPTGISSGPQANAGFTL